VTIVSFSGVDGAGKSTQISALELCLNQSGFRTQILTFWDDVVCFSRCREFMSYKAFKGDRGVGSPVKPLQRRDKNVSSGPLTIMRLGLYFADAVNLCLRVRQARKKTDADVLIFDRYIYDELANLPLTDKSARFFARFILKLVPKPDIALVIDADPVAAQARKPEYPLEFVRRNRESYLRVAELSGRMIVVEPDLIQVMGKRIRNEMQQTLSKAASSAVYRSSTATACAPSPANISSRELIEP
jgi:thymidylate kinase